MAASSRDAGFGSGHITLRGRLRLPDGAGPHPLVIMAHGMGGLKEWGNIPTTSDALVAAGIATLAFDYRNFGDSEGAPRDEVDPTGQIEDWRSAITFAATLPEIDAERIGIWGTSLGGRNVLAVAALDKRIKCVLSQVPPVGTFSPKARAYMATGTPDVAALNRALAEDRRDRALGKAPRYLPFADDNDPNTEYAEHIAAFGPEQTRNWNKRITLRSFEPSLADDVAHLVPQIAPTPLRMILTDRDSFCPREEQLKVFATAGEPKSLVVLPGHHYSLYTTWKDLAARLAREWSVEHLMAGAR